MPEKKAVVIGSGFSGLSAACFMAKAGWHVTVLEKNNMPGGRARKLEAAGFTFDMGPSWYWMPDVFERFFNQFGKSVSDYYKLHRLDPSYRVYWPDGPVDVPAGYGELQQLFEALEPGSAGKLDDFLKQAAYKYRVGMQKLVFKPGRSLFEFADWEVVKGIFRLDLFSSMQKHVAQFFSNPKLKELMEFPVLFLGALPSNTPALYSLMNYADMIGGTWFPEGGMYKVVESMHLLATTMGVNFHFNTPVTHLPVSNNRVERVVSPAAEFVADVVIASADYHFVETTLLPAGYQSYTNEYWNSRVMAPGCLIYYVGLSKKLIDVEHHMLFFDADFKKHSKEIYETKTWPSNPLFYVSITSKTDKNTAPPGCENLFFLIPVAPGLNTDTDELREHYFLRIVERMERQTGQSIKDSIVYKRIYSEKDFIGDYHSFKGNAYGLANTLLQTAVLKPKMKSRKLYNLYYTGQLTAPGPGVPPSLISGEVVANTVLSDFKFRGN